MDIKSFFERKKRGLSNKSDDGDNTKKAREQSSLEESIDTDYTGDIFTEGLKSGDCVAILYNCVKNIESKMKELITNSQDMKERQIKGERQLNELTNSINEKFEELEKDKKEKEIKIKNLEEKVSLMSNKIETLEKSFDNQEQYSRRNCLLVHGIEEKEGEQTDKVIIDTVVEKMNMAITSDDLDRSHRIGKKKEGNKSRLIIVKFSRYNTRHKIFSNKKSLKGTNTSITESLTATRMAKLKEARDEKGFKSVWTFDGKILFKNQENKTVVYYD